MANTASAEKRIRQNETRRGLNRWRNRRFREAIKDYRECILHGSVTDCETKLQALYKLLDQVAATPALHKNTASRYKSRLSTALNRKRSAVKV